MGIRECDTLRAQICNHLFEQQGGCAMREKFINFLLVALFAGVLITSMIGIVSYGTLLTVIVIALLIKSDVEPASFLKMMGGAIVLALGMMVVGVPNSIAVDIAFIVSILAVERHKYMPRRTDVLMMLITVFVVFTLAPHAALAQDDAPPTSDDNAVVMPVDEGVIQETALFAFLAVIVVLVTLFGGTILYMVRRLADSVPTPITDIISTIISGLSVYADGVVESTEWEIDNRLWEYLKLNHIDNVLDVLGRAPEISDPPKLPPAPTEAPLRG
jgi:hypothetical protein